MLSFIVTIILNCYLLVLMMIIHVIIINVIGQYNRAVFDIALFPEIRSEHIIILQNIDGA